MILYYTLFFSNTLYLSSLSNLNLSIYNFFNKEFGVSFLLCITICFVVDKNGSFFPLMMMFILISRYTVWVVNYTLLTCNMDFVDMIYRRYIGILNNVLRWLSLLLFSTPQIKICTHRENEYEL